MREKRIEDTKYRLRTIAVVIAGFFPAISLYAQISCTAKAPGQVSVGQPFNLTYSLNEQADKMPAIAFANFRYLGGPSQQISSSTVYGNGQIKTVQSYAYSYTLVADKEGTFTLPAVVFTVKNQQVKSNSLSITVTATQNQQQNQPSNKGKSSANTQGFNKDDFFIKASVSNGNPYVGEQVIVSYKLYLGPQTYRYSQQITTRPTTQDFWTYDLGANNTNPARNEETIDGKKYTVIDMCSMAVYPQKSGKLTISSLEAHLVVQMLVQRQSNDIFDLLFSDPFSGGNSVQNMELNVSSHPISMQAKELPETNKPAEFSGLVGNFKLSAKLSRNKLKANDAANLTVTVSGSGNLQYIEPLDFHFPTDIAVHDPEIRDNISPPLSGVSGSRTFEYVLIPRVEGDYVIAPTSFSYFDKRKGTYVVLSTPEFNLNVEKGEANNTVSFNANNKTDVKVLGTDIRYIKTNKALTLQETLFFASPFYWLLLLLPIVFFFIFIISLRKKIASQRNIALLRDKKASKTAKKRLRKAEKLLHNKQNEAFFIEISKVLWGYISDKFHIPLGQLSLDTAHQSLLQRKMKEDSINEFITTLQDCEYIRFAPSADITTEKMYERSFNFITKIERELKKA
jgi:hypothetical protein